MSKKKILLLCLGIILLIVVLIITFSNRKDNSSQSTKQTPKVEVATNFDEDTGLYYVKDEETGDILYASYDENDPSLEFYKEHPDYNPNPLNSRSRNLEDFIYSGEYGELEMPVE